MSNNNLQKLLSNINKNEAAIKKPNNTSGSKTTTTPNTTPKPANPNNTGPKPNNTGPKPNNTGPKPPNPSPKPNTTGSQPTNNNSLLGGIFNNNNDNNTTTTTTTTANATKKKDSEEPNILERGLNSITDTLGITNTEKKINNTSKNNTNSFINNLLKSENNEKAEKAKQNEAKAKAKQNEEKAKQSNKTESIIYKQSAPEPEKESVWWMIVKVIIMVVVLVIIYYVGKYLLNKYITGQTQTPYLLMGSKNGKNALVVSQDPANVNYIPINRSDGQDGIQFTYGFWFLLNGFDYKKGEWKHMFHKGNSSSYPNRAPGVWIHPDKNSIRVYMNTLDNILEYADVDNLPIRKWIYMNVILNNKHLDLYINGYLKIRKELSSLPKQNDDDFWVSMFGGFDGYISNIRYYSYAIDFTEINSMIKAGPSVNNCIDTGELPPYLDDNWWF